MPPSHGSYDAVVVGARCAGATAARLLAERGLDVLLVDRTRMPADTVSTHALMLGATIQLRRWGLLETVAATGATPVKGVTIEAGPTRFVAPIKNIGGVDTVYAPRRITLDQLLVDAAVAAGAELCDGHRVIALDRDSTGAVCGVRSTGPDVSTWSVRTRWVIGADGIHSTVAGLAGAATLRHDPASAACRYAYFAGLSGSTYEFSFARDAGAGAIPTDGGLTCVYVALPLRDATRMRRDLDAEFGRILRHVSPGLADRVAVADRVTGFRGTRGLPAHLRQATGPGWVLAGDAGYHRDPFSAHGITDAFRDGELVAHAVATAVVDISRADAAMRWYAELRDDFARPMYDATKRLASFKLDLDEILAVLHEMGDEGEREAHFLANLDDSPYVSEFGAAGRRPAVTGAPAGWHHPCA
jgi:flavin-dependent dehydrogenase